MITLPNKCRCSELAVTPKNWETGGKSLLKRTWFIKYRFYDDKTGQSKQVVVKGFNRYDDIDDRRTVVRDLLAAIKIRLIDRGFNPILNEYTIAEKVETKADIGNDTPFVEAIKYAITMLRVSDDTMKSETGFYANHIEKAAKDLKIAYLPVWDITLIQLYSICEKVAVKKDGKFSGDKFNRCKKVLQQLYKKLLRKGVVPANLPMSIEREKGGVKKKVAPPTKDQRKEIDEFLKSEYPRFWLYMHIFFHSGARTTEMIRLKVKDVDLSSQTAKYLVLKGKEYTEKERPILDKAVHYWQEAIGDAPGDYYIFGKGLLPSPTPIKSYQIKKRWRRLVQDKLGVTAGFYSLKHLHTTEVTKRIGRKAAADLNAESEEMIDRHYDLEKEQREHDEIKKQDISFI